MFSNRTFHFQPILQHGQMTRHDLEVCASQTGWTRNISVTIKCLVLVAGNVKEDADRLQKHQEEEEGSRATVPMQKDCNKIMLDLVKHQLIDKRNKPAL